MTSGKTDTGEDTGRIERRSVLKGLAAVGIGSGVATLPAAAGGQSPAGRLRASVLDRPVALGNGAVQSLPNEIEIRAATSDVRYTFTVSGDVELGPAAGDGDEIVDGNTVNGGISVAYPQGWDNYFFSGEITSFEVSAGRVQVLLNGTDVTDQIEQGAPAQPEEARCVEFSPISFQGQSAENFYGYTPSLDAANPRQSNTPTGLERPGVSRLFLFQGTEGLCLFIIHGGGEGEQGGAASFRISGLPESGSWVVLDDSHEETRDVFNLDSDPAVLHWAWGAGGRNDGAVFCGLGQQFRIRIDPAFNEAARRDPLGPGRIRAWQLLTGSATSPRTIDLPLDQPVVLQTGGC